ncbi:hypothetical protein F5Y16DRAFT_129638 [Xylariaceae sp. FL0255]|nr:hypothetical protein F5Y16DRAFT_129638 [Xylariaceae sp. FL0255]
MSWESTPTVAGRLPQPSNNWLDQLDIDGSGHIGVFDFTSDCEIGSFGFGQASVYTQSGGIVPPRAGAQCPDGTFDPPIFMGTLRRTAHQRNTKSNNSEPEEQHRRKLPKHHGEAHLCEGLSGVVKSPSPALSQQRSIPFPTGGSQGNQDSSSLGKRFACPFMKNPLGKNGTTMACLGAPGWPTIARLKEHIYRRHASDKYQCSRCLVKCESHSHLREHQRAEPPCAVKKRDHTACGDKLDEIQLAEIKKKSSRRLSEVEKWNEIYRIVFRCGADAEIPSPADGGGGNGGPPSTDSLTLFEEHLQTQIGTYGADHPAISTMMACLDLVRGFRQTSLSTSLSVSQVPSLGSYISEEMIASHLVARTPPTTLPPCCPAKATLVVDVSRSGNSCKNDMNVNESCCPRNLDKMAVEDAEVDVQLGGLRPEPIDQDFDMIFSLDLPDEYGPCPMP